MTAPDLNLLKRSAPPLFFLVAILSALVAALVFSTRPVGQGGDGPGLESAPASRPSPTGPEEGLLVADGATITDEVIARPLLAPSRRPASAVPAIPEQTAPAAAVPDEQVPAAVPEPVVVMKGYVWDGQAAQALLLWGEGSPAEWFRIGATRDGWTISRITSTSVTLSSGASDFTINLYQ
ncbi:MAG: hypothetical protein U1E48_00305 [Paracoccaceae bacterium]